jgi:hypothetical protein
MQNSDEKHRNFRAGATLGFGFLPTRCLLPQQRNKRGRRHGKGPIAPVGKPQFAKKLRIFNVNQLDAAGIDFVASK